MLAQPDLTTARLRVSPVETRFAQSMLDYQLRNRAHLAPWDPTPSERFFTLPYWLSRCRQRQREWQDGRCAAYVLLCSDAPDRVVGSLSLSNIQRGVAQSAILGYSIDAACQGQGLMFEALQAVIAMAFETLLLHRIQANYQPHNRRSAELLRRLGFCIEGRANRYLFLDGAWRDHILTALVNPRFNPEDILL